MDTPADLYDRQYDTSKRWRYVGTCACGGQDRDHENNPEEWEEVTYDAS